jgi:hypothetical protein
MPMTTSSSARAPFSASSLPTCGPTNSTRRSVAPGRVGSESLHHRLADLGGVLLGFEGQADQDVLAGAEILYREVGVAGLAEAVADLLQIGGLRVVDLDQRAAGELDREVQAAAEEEEHRQQESEQRDDVEHQRMAHEGDVFSDAEEFHLRAFPI